MPWVGHEEYAALASCFENNWITEGPKSEAFRRAILEMIGARYGVLAPNGTLALYLALRAAGVGPGDEVLVPDFTFFASASSVEMVGARPVFVDVNRRNFQIDLDGGDADRLVGPKTKAIMPVHIYGTVADMDQVAAFARRHGLTIVEDAAQALGARWKGKCAGTFGTTAAFSFFADKTITTAEGGMVVTDDADIYDRLLYLRNQGRKDRGSFIHPEVGYNFRMTDLQAAVGLVQLSKFARIVARKAELLQLYRRELHGIPGLAFFEP
jgi:perosamine synthetase